MAEHNPQIPERIAMLSRNQPRYLCLSPDQQTTVERLPKLPFWDRTQQMRIEELLLEGPWTAPRRVVAGSPDFSATAAPFIQAGMTMDPSNAEWSNGLNMQWPVYGYGYPSQFEEASPQQLSNWQVQPGYAHYIQGEFASPHIPTYPAYLHSHPPVHHNLNTWWGAEQSNTQGIYSLVPPMHGSHHQPILHGHLDSKTGSKDANQVIVGPVGWTFISTNGTVHDGIWIRRPIDSPLTTTSFSSEKLDFGRDSSDSSGKLSPSRVPGVLFLQQGLSEVMKDLSLTHGDKANDDGFGEVSMVYCSTPHRTPGSSGNRVASAYDSWTVLRRNRCERAVNCSKLSVPFNDSSSSSPVATTASARATQMISTLPHAQRWETSETVRFPDVERNDWMFSLPAQGSGDSEPGATSGTSTARPTATKRFLLSTIRLRTSKKTWTTEGEWYFWIYELVPFTVASAEDNGGKVPPVYVFPDLNLPRDGTDRFELKTRVSGWADRGGVVVKFEYAAAQSTLSPCGWGRDDSFTGYRNEEKRKEEVLKRELAVLYWVILTLKSQAFSGVSL